MLAELEVDASRIKYLGELFEQAHGACADQSRNRSSIEQDKSLTGAPALSNYLDFPMQLPPLSQVPLHVFGVGFFGSSQLHCVPAGL
jgi:hypothetical protein